MPRSFNSNVKLICQALGLNSNPEQIGSILKSNWKKEVKSSIDRYVYSKLQQSTTTMTKLRHLKKDQFKRKVYIEEFSSYLTKKILLIRLNMCRAKENFRRPNESPLCSLGCGEVETTEHLISCKTIWNEPMGSGDLSQDDNINLWKKIVERVDTFVNKVEELQAETQLPQISNE